MAYSINELEECARQHALNENRNWAVDYDWWEFIYEDAKRIGDLLGIKIKNISFEGFWSQGNGASFDGQYWPCDDAVAKIKEEAPKDEELHAIAEALHAWNVAHALTFGDKIQYADILRSKYFNMNVLPQFTSDTFIDTWHWDEWGKSLKELLQRFAQWIYRQLETEYDYLTSDKHLIEVFMDNDLRFDEAGSIL